MAFFIHALIDAGFPNQVDKALLKNTGANTAEYVIRANPLDNNVVDTRFIQQLPQ